MQHRLLSASVGTALQFLTANKIEGFSDTTGTQKFVFTIDRLFDTFNSRTPKASGYKQALTVATFRKVAPFLREARNILMNMTDSQGKKLCESRRHMAALGFVVNIDSLFLLVDEILLDFDNTFKQKYLLTYKLSQDHLELYFGSIRRMGGWNNNPSAWQFAYAYRALLSRASVSGSNAANIVSQDETDLLHLSPDASKVDQFERLQFTTDHDYCHIAHLSLFVTNVLEYIAGWVVRRLSPEIACSECLSALVVTANDSGHTDSLLVMKNNGGLVKPSTGVIAVVTQVLRESVNVHKVVKDDLWG